MGKIVVRKEGAVNYEDLTPEQQSKAKACKTLEDVLALAKEEGYELTDEELEGAAGGSFWSCGDNFCTDYRGEELDQDPGWN